MFGAWGGPQRWRAHHGARCLGLLRPLSQQRFRFHLDLLSIERICLQLIDGFLLRGLGVLCPLLGHLPSEPMSGVRNHEPRDTNLPLQQPTRRRRTRRTTRRTRMRTRTRTRVHAF